jgi:NADH-quinone oxidoreductase subunit E
MQDQINQVFSRHKSERSELIPILQELQETLGYLPNEAMAATANFLEVPRSTVYGVATFYAQFYFKKRGEHIIRICRGTACHVKGSLEIMEAICRKLDVEPGGTSGDGKFTLERVACVGSCALAPVVVIDDKVFGDMTADKTLKLLDSIIEGSI